METRIALVALSLLSAPPAAYAHAPKIGHNGGPQTNAGGFHLEVVPQGTTVAVYLRDHGDRAVPTDGYKGTATFVIDGRSEVIPLVPAGENKLTGAASVSLPAQIKGAVQITMPAGGAVQGKF